MVIENRVCFGDVGLPENFRSGSNGYVNRNSDEENSNDDLRNSDSNEDHDDEQGLETRNPESPVDYNSPDSSSDDLYESGKRQRRKQLQVMKARHKKELSQCRDKCQKRKLQQFHAAEIANFSTEHLLDESESQAGGVVERPSGITSLYGPEKPISKQMRKKLLKEQQYEQRLVKRTDGPSKGTEEYSRLEEFLNSKRLSIFKIPPDGHCMFRAIEHQLSLKDSDLLSPEGTDDSNYQIDSSYHNERISFSTLRTWAAAFMMEHRDSFESFFEAGYIDEDTSYIGQGRTFEDHCNDIGTSTAWGGEFELSALSQKLGRTIEVFIAGVPEPRIYGPDAALCNVSSLSRPLRLSFHRFMYNSGCHYNSVIPIDLLTTQE